MIDSRFSSSTKPGGVCPFQCTNCTRFVSSAARPPGMVQQLVISGQDPSIALQQNQFGQQVFTVPGGMLQANVRAQTMLAPRMMPQGHRLPKPANSVPSWRP